LTAFKPFRPIDHSVRLQTAGSCRCRVGRAIGLALVFG
jgi:hypothetical protein